MSKIIAFKSRDIASIYSHSSLCSWWRLMNILYSKFVSRSSIIAIIRSMSLDDTRLFLSDVNRVAHVVSNWMIANISLRRLQSEFKTLRSKIYYSIHTQTKFISRKTSQRDHHFCLYRQTYNEFLFAHNLLLLQVSRWSDWVTHNVANVKEQNQEATRVRETTIENSTIIFLYMKRCSHVFEHDIK